MLKGSQKVILFQLQKFIGVVFGFKYTLSTSYLEQKTFYKNKAKLFRQKQKVYVTVYHQHLTYINKSVWHQIKV